MSCPDPDTLATFPTLVGEDRARVVDHAAECETCRAIISNMVGMDETAPATPAVRGPDVERPEKIDRYTIERQLGAGAMGVVYAGYDPELARPVAVKVLRAGGSPERMKREAQALAKLTHANVVAVYDVGEHAGSTFVTMALVDGENLRVWLRGERTTEQIVDAIVQAARGIDAAHRVGIIHRDLKPDNIFVARTGEVLVGDFGLARSAGPEAIAPDARLLDSSELTQTGTLVGTPAYMAPEQLNGEASAASDQFALCVTAWEALYAKRPFTGKSLGELERAVRAGPPPDPKTRDVPAHVRKAIRRGLAADPAARHPSIAALITALSPRRRRWPYAVALGALAIGGAAAFFALREDAVNPEAACEQITGPPTQSPGLAKIALPAVRRSAEDKVSHYAVAWTRLAHDACLAHARRELSDPLYATTTRCLARRAATFAWALRWELPETMPEVIEALEPIETCRLDQATPEPPVKVAEFQTQLDQLALVVRASPSQTPDYQVFLKDATALGDDGAIGEASYVSALSRLAAGRDAEDLLRSAITHADRARDDRIRARASAVLAETIARSGRVGEASSQRDVAASAAVRSNDPLTLIAVERANAAIAFARKDTAKQLEALRRIEELQAKQLGDPSFALVTTRFDIAGALESIRDPHAGEAFDRALATATKFSPNPLLALQQAAMRASPAESIVLGKQIIELTRREQPALLPRELATLAIDNELVGDFEGALAASQEGLALVDAASELHDDLVETAANAALEIADRTDDASIRKRRLEQALELLDRSRADNDRTQSLRGRTLALQARYAEALPLLTTALATAEKQEPPNPFRVAVRSFALAQVLWEIGGTQDRARALALAEQAAKRLPEARELFGTDPKYGSALDRLARTTAQLEAWRRTHR
jgi:predicted Ser/Thr protein kinase